MAGFTPFTAQLALSSLLLVDILTLPQADLATALYWMPQRALVLSLSLLHC
jgi:hydroxylamine reductase (hybrid-cluster protein)